MEEEHAAKVVQRSLGQHLSRRREQSMATGTVGYQRTLRELQQSLPLIEPSIDELGAIVLRLAINSVAPIISKGFNFSHIRNNFCMELYYFVQAAVSVYCIEKLT